MGRALYGVLIPGLIFQSVVIGGGYATGRELVQFFLANGPVGGALGLAVTTAIWSVMLMLTFEVARLNQSFDYRSFFKVLLGRLWPAYELLFVIMAVLVLAVLGSASGNIFVDHFGVDELVGIVALMSAIAILAFQKSDLLEKLIASWSIVLYGAYAALIVWGLTTNWTEISEHFAASRVEAGWFGDGFKYASYNLSSLPAVLFCLRNLKSRRQSFVSGALAGPLGILPAVCLYVVMVGYYPGINDAPVPLTYLLGLLGAPWFSFFFQVVIFGTFIETGTALIHMINERIDQTMKESGTTLPPTARPAIAFALCAVSVFVAAKVGIVALIAKGYGLLVYGFAVVYVLPLLTVGVRRIFSVQPKAKELDAVAASEDGGSS